MSKNKLRFKDDSGSPYPNTITHNLGSIISPLPKSKISVNDAKSYDGAGLPCFTSGNNILTWSKALSDSPTIMMNDGGVASVNFYDGKCAYTDHVFAFNAASNIDASFLHYAIEKEIVKIDREFFKGSGLKNLDKTGLLKYFMVNVPSLPEQEKIAALFSKLDERIELREQKIVNLKEYKKGLQQAVFGNNGERTLRFKDKNGNDYPDWVEVKVKDFGAVITGSTPPKANKLNWDSEDHIWVSPADMGKVKYIKHTSNNISRHAHSKQRILNAGDIMVTCIGSTIGKMGIIGTEGSTNQQINSIQVNNHYNNEYIYYVILNDINKIRNASASTAVPIINKSSFEDIAFYVSVSLEEQEKIANLFSKIDNQIELEEQLLQATKDEKQGLMQRVF